MIELTAQDGSRLFVNPDAICHIRSNGTEFSAIFGAYGAALLVRGGIDEVAARVTEFRRAERARLASLRLHIVKDRPEGG